MDSEDEMLLPDELIEEIEDMCADTLADCLTRLESTFSRSPVACTSAPAPAASVAAIVAATSLPKMISNNQYRKVAPDPIVTARVEAVAIDHGSVGGQAKHPRARVAGLGQWGHGANFDSGEAEGGQRGDSLCILVKTRRQPKTVGQGFAEQADGGLRA